MTEQNNEVETEVVETEVEIPEETVNEIAEEVAKRIASQSDAEKDALKKEIEQLKAKAVESEPVIRKNVFGTTKASQGFETARKEQRLFKHVKAAANRDGATIKHMNDFNLAKFDEYTDDVLASKGVQGRYLNKASYNNYTDNEEGGYLIPDPEFLISIERFEAQYGVGFANATVRTTERQQVKANIGTENVELYETGEGAQKTQTKPEYDQVQSNMRKFAGIVVATDEFTDDEAAGFWQDVTAGFGRARARKADEILFTENATQKGILHTPGVLTEPVGSAITGLKWDDLLDLESVQLPEATINAKYVFHPTVWNILRKSKGTTNDHYLAGLGVDGKTTPWGTPVLTSQLFRTAADATNNVPFGVYGDLSKLQLWVNGGLALKFLYEGTVGDLNLAEQDMTGLRAVTRMTKLVTIPSRFTIIGTGSVS